MPLLTAREDARDPVRYVFRLAWSLRCPRRPAPGDPVMTAAAPAVTAPRPVTTSTAPPVTRGSGRQLTDYAELLGRVQAPGLLERHYAYFAVKILLPLAAVVAVCCGSVCWVSSGSRSPTPRCSARTRHRADGIVVRYLNRVGLRG
jgi:hypothetical protein